ncbi:dephospho-CoA kinase [bacterium]|nr:dephospho-CoA kinase [bacterium]
MIKSDRYIMGVSGYLGSGKTTALSFLEKRGFSCIDADEIVHDLYEPGEDGWRKIKDFFGEEFLVGKDEKVNRSKLRKVVFNNVPKLKILEKIIHPLVFNEMRKRIHRADSNKIAIESIKFDEKRMGTNLDKIIWIDAPRKMAYERMVKNMNISIEEYNTIRQLQEKPVKIDFVIKNNKGLDEFSKKVDEVIQSLVK